MTAALGLHLILQMQSRGTGARELPNGARNAECAAEAGIRIDQQWQGAGGGDAADLLADIIQGGHAQIRQPEGTVGDPGARQVQGTKSGLRGQQRGVRTDRADDLQWRSIRARRADVVPLKAST